MNVKDLELPPHNLEAEKGLLSCIMMDNKILYYITDFKKNFFFGKTHKEIFWIMVDLHSKKQTIDPITIWESYDDMDELWDISTFVVSPTVYKEYVKIIKDNYIYRDVIKQAQIISWMAYNKESVEDITKKLQKTIESSFVDEDKLQSIETDITSRVMEYFQNIEDKKNWIHEMAISTWYPNLDEIMVWWLKKQHLNFIAWRPWMMKTLYSLNILENVARQWKVGMFISLEMSKDQLVDRMIARNTKIPMWKITKADLTQTDVETISNVWEKIMKYKLYLDDKNKWTIESIRAKLMECDDKVDVIVVDYIQRMKCTEKVNGAYEELTKIANWLKDLAKEFDLCVIWLVQLNRWVESRTNKRPLLSDMSWTWALEMNADMVVWLYRDEYYDKETDRPWLIEMEILKNRHWETKTIYWKASWEFQEITETEFEENDMF